MLSSQIAGNRFAVKSGALLVKFADDIYGTEIGFQEFDNLYAFCKQHLHNFEHRLIDEHTNMHGAIQLMADLLFKEMGLYVAIVPGEVRIGKPIENDRYDFYSMSLIWVQRVWQADLQRVLCICLNKLDQIDPDTNNTWSVAVETMYNYHFETTQYNDQEEILSSSSELRHYEEVICGFIDTMYSHGSTIGNAEVNRVCKKYPKYAPFIRAVMKFDRCRSQLVYHDFEACNDSDVLDPDNRFIVYWDDRESGYAIDNEVTSYAQSFYENFSCGMIGSYIVAGEEDLSLLKGRLKKLELLIDVLSTHYECYDQ